jgi:membrane dipeptidase
VPKAPAHFFVDAHLDLAYNALRGRDVLRPASEQIDDGHGIPTVGLPDLRAGKVGLICATLFARPATPDGRPGYRTAQGACDVAAAQLAWYREHESRGHFRLVRTASDLLADSDPTKPLPTILLMEGADPLRTPDDLPGWFDAGLRILGLAWGQTRYAGGTGAPGPLTSAARELLPHVERFGIIHDASHLADESFFQLLDLTAGPLMASHSNCRAIVPGDRHLSDAMIRAIIARQGVIGINFYDQFLLPRDEYGKRRATLQDVVRHIDHVCDLAGDAKHVAIGTDMDGGLGRDEIPEEIVTAADLPKVGNALREVGYDEESVSNILADNWLRFFATALPKGPA